MVSPFLKTSPQPSQASNIVTGLVRKQFLQMTGKEKKAREAEEKTHWLRTRAALAEDPGLGSSSPPAIDPVPRDLAPSFS